MPMIDVADGICHSALLCPSPKEYAKTSNEGDDIFLCEYENDIIQHTFKRLAEIDNGGEVWE